MCSTFLTLTNITGALQSTFQIAKGSICNLIAYTYHETYPKRVLLSILIVTIDPSKDTEKYIADNEAVWSNKKSPCKLHTSNYDQLLR